MMVIGLSDTKTELRSAFDWLRKLMELGMLLTELAERGSGGGDVRSNGGDCYNQEHVNEVSKSFRTRKHAKQTIKKLTKSAVRR